MDNSKLWIGGKWVEAESGKTFPTFNPTTGEEIARIPLADKADVDKAVAAARKAYPAWSRMMQAERSQIMRKIADAIRKNGADFTRLETLEHGSVVELANHVPMAAAGNFEGSAVTAQGLIDDFVTGIPNVMTYIKREPIGVAGIITPWNHALIMMATKLAQALSVGNTCVLKPPSVNSLVGLKFAEALEQADLPPGVVNVVTGPGSVTGNAIATHPDVNVIGFTGSSETGKALMAAASPTLKRLTMELGGKNPVIVLKDADLDETVKFLAVRQCDNAGQHCSGAGRYYVHEDVYEEFVEKFIAESKKVVVGDPADKNTVMGPLASREHRDRVEAYIRSGVEEGAKLLLGGERPTTPPMSQGWYVMPTVLAGATQDMKIAREEIFGPVAVIMQPFSSEEKVIELANDNVYGLCASVWTKDTARGMTFMNKLHAGTVWVNTMALGPGMPWGGFKDSGIGKEGGREGHMNYTQLKGVGIRYF
ncbi:MAG: aldehyde dehydrogenase [Dehalococcoidales bacterium]|nr:aldehyde dehydrogenase [Dehalococcoidales bacterium]